MKVEVLVATMHQKDHSLVEKMNIQTDAVIINQCDREDHEEFEHNGKRIKFISNKERGLSRSRNLAIKSASGDICIIADDDIVYQDGYEEMVKKAYQELPEADLIVFDIAYENEPEKSWKFGKDKIQMGLRRALQVNSVRITYKLNSIKDKDIKFNTLFGAGSIYNHGEENIFIKECIRKGLKIYYFPITIASIRFRESTWFKGYDEKYFFDIGAIYYELFKSLYLLFGIRLLLRFRNQLKDTTILNSIKSIIAGKKEYKQRRGENERSKRSGQ
jgi:glycosyltransferase involved in cell wall biosynthesis